MAGYRELDFNERRAASQKARKAALDQLKARPPLDEAERARRLAERTARDAAHAEKRRAAKEARLQAAKTNAEPVATEDRASAAPAQASSPTEAERKAARDAKYAARKKNKARR